MVTGSAMFVPQTSEDQEYVLKIFLKLGLFRKVATTCSCFLTQELNKKVRCKVCLKRHYPFGGIRICNSCVGIENQLCDAFRRSVEKVEGETISIRPC